MEIVLHSLNGVLTVLIMIAIGAFLERKGWFDDKGVVLVSKLVTQVCLPTYMLTNILSRFQHDQLISMSNGLIVPFLSMMAGYFISKLIAKIVGIPSSRAGIFTACVSFSNTIFIGLPLGIALFGDAGAPYIMIYYMVNTTLFWTLGVYELASGAGTNTSLFSKQTIRNILSLPLLGFMVGVVMVILELQLPAPIFKAFAYIGGMTTPLAMMFIGIAMSKTNWSEIRLGKELVVAMLGRYFVCPVIVIAMLPFFELEPLMEKVFVMIAAMPAMTNTAIVAKAYGGDYKYAAMLTAVSTVLAVVMIPFYMWIIH